MLKEYSVESWIINNGRLFFTSDCMCSFGRGTILWSSKKQACLTSLTMKSEFVALTIAGKEARWLKNSLLESISSISTHCDS